jgi:hypothetical protein
MIGMAPLQPVMRALYSRELHHGHKQISLFAVAIPFIAITIVVVFLRIYVRLRLVKLAMAADDCRLAASTFSVVPNNADFDRLDGSRRNRRNNAFSSHNAWYVSN